MKLTLQLQAQLLSSSSSIKNAGYLALSIALVLYAFKTSHHDFLFAGLLSSILILCLTLHYLYIRLHFDQKLLMLLAEQYNQQQYSEQKLSLELDQALLALGLIHQNKVGRDWSTRFKGCMKLFKLQFICLIIQYFCLLFFVLY